MSYITWKRTVCLAVASLGIMLGNVAMAQSSPGVATLRADTPVTLIAVNGISSADAAVGDTVLFIIANDLMVDNAIVVKRGTWVLADVTRVVKARFAGRSGTLSLHMEPLSVGSKTILLQANVNGSNNGEVRYEQSFHWKFPLGMFRSGDDVEIHSGASLTVFVAEDVELPVVD
jgi:hypothetical protein